MFKNTFGEFDINDLLNRVHAIQKHPQPGTNVMDLLGDSYQKDQLLRMITDQERKEFRDQFQAMRALQIYNSADFAYYLLPEQTDHFLNEMAWGKLSKEEALNRKIYLEKPMRTIIEADPTDIEMKRQLELVCNAFLEYSNLSDEEISKRRAATTKGDQKAAEKVPATEDDTACLAEFRCDGVNDPDLELAKMYAKYSGLSIDLSSLQEKEFSTDTEKRYGFVKVKEDETLVHEETVSVFVSDHIIGLEQEHHFFSKTDLAREWAYVIRNEVSFTREGDQLVKSWWETQYDQKGEVEKHVQNIPHSEVSYPVSDDFTLRGTLTPQKVHVFTKK